ncbi:MAG: hypothetical protein KAS07_03430 [Candidatus Pacebacteria bacterium]|nr:hypothetical protein [Candidatus Paceibacterota bacterium]
MNIREIVKEVIDDVLVQFQKYPDVFLTEEDVRSCMVSRLLSYEELSLPSRTSERSLSIPVHSEVRWYGRSGVLKYRSDIVVLDVSSLKTGKYLKVPSKSYGFNKFYAVIELKLRRKNSYSDNKFFKLVESDFKKIQKIIREINFAGTNTFDADYYLICLDKKNDMSERFDDFNAHDSGISFEYSFKKI